MFKLECGVCLLGGALSKYLERDFVERDKNRVIMSTKGIF